MAYSLTKIVMIIEFGVLLGGRGGPGIIFKYGTLLVWGRKGHLTCIEYDKDLMLEGYF